MTHSIDAPLPHPRHHGHRRPPAPRRPRHQGRRQGRGQERQGHRRPGRQPGRLDRDRPGQAGRPGDPAPGQGPARPGPLPAQATRPSRQQQKAGRGPVLPRPGAARHWPTAPARARPARPVTCSSRPRAWSRTSRSKLQNREPAELLDEVRSFARRKPGMFLLGAAAAGILAGRLTSGVKAAHSDSGPAGSGSANGYRGSEQLRRPGAGLPRRRPPRRDPGRTGDGARRHGSGTGAPLPPPPYGTVPPGGQRRAAGHPRRLGRPGSRPGGVG